MSSAHASDRTAKPTTSPTGKDPSDHIQIISRGNEDRIEEEWPGTPRASAGSHNSPYNSGTLGGGKVGVEHGIQQPSSGRRSHSNNRDVSSAEPTATSTAEASVLPRALEGLGGGNPLSREGSEDLQFNLGQSFAQSELELLETAGDDQRLPSPINWDEIFPDRNVQGFCGPIADQPAQNKPFLEERDSIATFEDDPSAITFVVKTCF